MPHLVEVWDQSDSDSDTNTTTALDHLFGTESEDEHEDEVVEQQPPRVRQQQRNITTNYEVVSLPFHFELGGVTD